MRGPHARTFSSIFSATTAFCTASDAAHAIGCAWYVCPCFQPAAPRSPAATRGLISTAPMEA